MKTLLGLSFDLSFGLRDESNVVEAFREVIASFFVLPAQSQARRLCYVFL
jgi:hypothetical protein